MVAERILGALAPATGALLGELLVLTSVDSTNAEVLRRMAAGSRSGVVCTAEQQSAGRGRRRTASGRS